MDAVEDANRTRSYGGSFLERLAESNDRAINSFVSVSSSGNREGDIMVGVYFETFRNGCFFLYKLVGSKGADIVSIDERIYGAVRREAMAGHLKEFNAYCSGLKK